MPMDSLLAWSAAVAVLGPGVAPCTPTPSFQWVDSYNLILIVKCRCTNPLFHPSPWPKGGVAGTSSPAMRRQLPAGPRRFFTIFIMPLIPMPFRLTLTAEAIELYFRKLTPDFWHFATSIATSNCPGARQGRGKAKGVRAGCRSRDSDQVPSYFGSNGFS